MSPSQVPKFARSPGERPKFARSPGERDEPAPDFDVSQGPRSPDRRPSVEEDDYISVVDYSTAGGLSRVARFDDGEELTIELHPDAYSVVWTSKLAADRWIERIGPLLPETDATAVLISPKGDVLELSLHQASVLLHAPDAGQSFVRLQYPDRAFTWETSLFSHEEHPGRDAFFEVGFVADGFDFDYVADCVASAATPRVAARAKRLLNGFSQSLTRFPDVDLGSH